MYKTKLQEVCQQRQWSLPKYSSMKDGADHNPRFKATVSVNGLSFHSPSPTTSSKLAQNNAAHLAFLHFTPPSGPKIKETPLQQDSNSNISGINDGSLTASAETNAGELTMGETSQSSRTHSQALGVIDDVGCHYKRQLQNYAQWKNFGAPLYSSKSEGPSHALCFKATVTVDGRSFESPEFSRTLKEAEHAAAKAALMSLSLDGFQEEYSGFYKNLLQELAQREDFSIPVYKTMKSGAPHMPTFFSTVEVEGEIFYGKAGKSKKVAEIKAAKFAYTILRERGLSWSTGFTSSNLAKSTSSSDFAVTVDSQRNLKDGCPLFSPPAIKYEEQAKESEGEVQEVNSAEMVSANDKVGSEDSNQSPAISYMDKMLGNQDSSSSVPTALQEGSMSSALTHPDISALSISNSNVGKVTGIRSYLLCNRVRIYPCFPDIAFPKGITVLPISDNRWVAVSLDFPNEEGN